MDKWRDVEAGMLTHLRRHGIATISWCGVKPPHRIKIWMQNSDVSCPDCLWAELQYVEKGRREGVSGTYYGRIKKQLEDLGLPLKKPAEPPL